VRLLLVALVSLIVVSVAAAAPGDPKKVIVPAIQAKAKAINVQRSDLPGKGWKAGPQSSKSSTPRCSTYNPNQSDLTENADVDSPEFSLPSSSSVSSSTGIFKTAAQGRTAYSRVVIPKLPGCLAEIFQKGAGGPSKVTILSAGPMASFPKLADRSNAFRIAASFKASATQKIPVFIDLVVLNRGKVDTVIFFLGIGGSFSSSFERALATRVAGRMASV